MKKEANDSDKLDILKRTADKLKITVNYLLEKHLRDLGAINIIKTDNKEKIEPTENLSNELLQPFLEDIAEITGCMNSTIWIYEEEGKKLRLKAATGYAKKLWEEEKIKHNIFYEIDTDEAVTIEIWKTKTGDNKYAYGKKELSIHQGKKGVGKFDHINKGHNFEVFYGLRLEPFKKKIGVIKIENSPGQKRPIIDEEYKILIEKANELNQSLGSIFDIAITKDQIEDLRRHNFNIDIAFLEKYCNYIPYYDHYKNFLDHQLKFENRDIRGVEITSRIKSLRSVIKKICRKDKLDENWDTKYKKKYFFRLFTDLAGIRIIVNNLVFVDKIVDRILQLIETDKNWLIVEKAKEEDTLEYPVMVMHKKEDMMEEIKKQDNQNKKFECNRWIEQSKENDGYRGVHFVVGRKIKVEGKNAPSFVLCEIQIRTIREHSWATENHELLYKKDVPAETIKNEMIALSDSLFKLDKQFVNIRKKIERGGGSD